MIYLFKILTWIARKLVCFRFQVGGVKKFKVYTPTDLDSIIVPEGKIVRIDVGLSDDASHSVVGLLDFDDRFFIGIEPHPANIKGLIWGVSKESSLSLARGFVRKGSVIKRLGRVDDKFVLIQGCVDITENSTIEPRRFFGSFPDRGNSSLYNVASPESTGNVVESELVVKSFPLSMIFERVLNRKDIIVELLKIDTEGNDLNVLRSASVHLKKCLFVQVECFCGVYENTKYIVRENAPEHYEFGDDGYFDSSSAICAYMELMNFTLISSKPGEYLFLNCGLQDLLKKRELTF